MSYQGGTTLNTKTGSVITLNLTGTAGQQFPVGTAVTLTGGGTVNLGSYGQTIGSLASAAGVGTINLSGPLTLGGTAGSPVNQPANYGGTIAGAGGVTMNGLGTQIFSGANSYTGGTTVNAGTLQIGAGGGSGTLGGTVGTVSLGSGTTLAFDRSDTCTVANPIRGSGSLLQMGSGTVILTARTATATLRSTPARRWRSTTPARSAAG